MEAPEASCKQQGHGSWQCHAQRQPSANGNPCGSWLVRSDANSFHTSFIASLALMLPPPRRRYQYDPNPRVREAMGAIWRALVPEPRAAVEAHWDAIAAELLGELGGRLWRNREAAALGLADLLQARFLWPFSRASGCAAEPAAARGRWLGAGRPAAGALLLPLGS
jgi:hypothetical protein